MSGSEIPCPDCGTMIPIDTRLLIEGMQFQCPNPKCRAEIALSQPSAGITEETMKKFEQLKADLMGKD
ncbi:MAG: hypothetical protein ACWA47_03665 [Brevirhabdus sp.]